MDELNGLRAIISDAATQHGIEEPDPPYFQGASPFWRTAVDNATAPAPVFPDVLIQAWIDIWWAHHLSGHERFPPFGARGPSVSDG